MNTEESKERVLESALRLTGVYRWWATNPTLKEDAIRSQADIENHLSQLDQAVKEYEKAMEKHIEELDFWDDLE